MLVLAISVLVGPCRVVHTVVRCLHVLSESGRHRYYVFEVAFHDLGWFVALLLLRIVDG